MSCNSALTTISLIDDTRHLQRALDALRSHTPLVLDIEGVNLGRRGRVTMIQLCAAPNQVFCFDIVRIGPEAVEGIRPMLEDPSILKLCYDARCDADAMLHCHGVRLRGLYDLQIAYTLCHQDVKDPYLKGLQHALQHPGVVNDSDLVDILARKRQCKTLMRNLGSYHMFMQRPIPVYVLEYCAVDVVFLFNMFSQWAPVCSNVSDTTEKRVRAYVDAECQRSPRLMSLVDFPRGASSVQGQP